MSGDAGVAVAGGDPALVYNAARWHELLADDLDRHAAVIDHTAGSLATVWRGEAASCYQGLSHTVAGHFRIAADCSRSASLALQRYAEELERYQREGRHCLAEAEHWRGQVAAGEATLARAERAVPAAQAAVSEAQRALHHAEQELRHWQARGRMVLEEANEAGRSASRTLGSLSVAGAAGAPAAVGTPAAFAGSPAHPGTSAAADTPAGAGTTPGGPHFPAVDSGARQGAITFGDLEEIGRRFGWSHSELEAWWQVISDESGGNPAATNAGSGAFGIGQFLGSTFNEYLRFGAGSPNPLDQLNAMAHYIHDRYGNPLAALGHESAYHWY